MPMRDRKLTPAAAAALMLGVCACQRPAAPDTVAIHPLDPASQRAAADKIARAFVGPCLAVADALSTTRKLQAQGWPAFATMWNEPDSVFYAAKPSPASPASLYVLGDRQDVGGFQGAPTVRIASLECVGHYAADDAKPMVRAIEARWGPSREGPARTPGSRSWSFLYKGGVLTPLPIAASSGGPATAAALAGLGPGEALVSADVSYNAAYHDVASGFSIRWRP
jgi:hypothetical protein